MKHSQRLFLKLFFILIPVAIPAFPQDQDVSDKPWSIIIPKATARDIDLGQALTGSIKDSIIAGFIANAGKPEIRIDNILLAGTNADQFAILSGTPPYVIPPGQSKSVEFHFKPTSVGIKKAQILVITQVDTLVQALRGESVAPKLEVAVKTVDFGSAKVYASKDTMIKAVIKNIGKGALEIKSALIDSAGGQFQILQGGGSFKLGSGKRHEMRLKFAPANSGRISGRIVFDYASGLTPAVTNLYGVGLPRYAVVKGKVKDSKGNSLEAAIKWELLKGNNKIELGATSSGATDGSYQFQIPLGDHYGYYFVRHGYYPVSKDVDLRNDRTERTIESDVVLVSIQELQKQKIAMRVNNIFFDYDKFDLKPESFSELDRLAQILKDYPTMKVEIAGHTDDQGTDPYNLNLSQNRAKAVVTYLTAAGCNTKNLIARGYGESKPVATNQTEEGRAQNRRVEFRFQ